MRFIWTKLMMLFLLLWVSPLFAAAKPEVPTIGEIAGKLIIGTDFVTKLVLVACIVVGVILVISAIGQFRSHYYSPKMVPLDRPIIYLILGISLFFVPFLGDIFVRTSSTIDLKKKEASTLGCPVDVDAPLEFGNEFDH